MKKKFKRLVAEIKVAYKIKKIRDNNNTICVDKNIYSNLKLNIQGTGNIIKLSNLRLNDKAKIHINIYGNNNIINLEDVDISAGLGIYIGQNHKNFGEVNKSRFEIGKGTSIEDMTYCTFNSNAFCIIGERCMISYDITLYNTDAHPVMDKETLRVINKVKGIYIGDHCWIGQKASILKNTVIPNDCIIGYGAVVSGVLKEENAAYAGNPAKCIKNGITWNSNGRQYGYIDNVID